MRQDHTRRRYWERHATNYDRSMALLGGPVAKMAALAADEVRGAARVLEVAAGTGLVTTSIARSAGEIVATDYAVAMVARVQARARAAALTNVRCEQADLYALRYGDGAFDAVVAANLLHLVPDLPGALRALRRALRPGGRVVVPTYCHDETRLSWAASRLLALTGFPGHRRFTAASLREALEAEGVVIARAALLPGVIPIAFVSGTFRAA